MDLQEIALTQPLCIEIITSFISFNFGTFLNDAFYCGFKNFTIMNVTNLTSAKPFIITKDWFFFLNGKFEMNANFSALMLSVSNIS